MSLFTVLRDGTATAETDYPRSWSSGSGSSSIADVASLSGDDGLTSTLSRDAIQYLNVDATGTAPPLDEVREHLIRRFPDLVAVGKTVTEPTKFKSGSVASTTTEVPACTPAQREALEKALSVHCQDVEYKQHIKGIIVLERRVLKWKALAPAAQEEAVEAHPTSLPSPWLLKLDCAKLLAKAKSPRTSNTFQLPAHKHVSQCGGCQGTGNRLCIDCQGIPTDDCFYCNGTGKQRKGLHCDVCHGSGHYQCNTCDNKGQKKCETCQGSAKTHVGLFVTVKLKTVELPPIRLDSLVEQDKLHDEAFTRQAAIDKVWQAAVDLQTAPGGGRNAFVPVLAYCLVESFVLRKYLVHRQAPESALKKPVNSLKKVFRPSNKTNCATYHNGISATSSASRLFAVSSAHNVQELCQ